MAARTPDRRPRSPARASGAEAARKPSPGKRASGKQVPGKQVPGKRASGKPSPGKRAPGRPGADAPELRPRLLDAALACYVDKGIAATSLRDIARRAAVTPAMLHYYFGDKERLREAVIAERLLPAIAGLSESVLGAGDDPADLIGAFVNGLVHLASKHPWLPPLWVREILSEGGALRGVLLDQVGPMLARGMAARFAAAQAAGRLNPELDPRLLMVSLVGLTMFPAAGAPIWRRLFDADDLPFDAVRRHALVLLDRGLELEHGKED